MQPNGHDQEKIIDIAEARRRQKTVNKARAGASKGGRQGGNGGDGGNKKPAPKIWVYLQLLVFLGLVSYMMQLCKG